MHLVINVRRKDILSYAAALGARDFTAKSNSADTNCDAHKDIQLQ